MNKCLYIITLLLFFTIKVHAGNTGSFEYSNSYALLIGVENYEHYNDCDEAFDQVYHLKAFLKKEGFACISSINPNQATINSVVPEFLSNYGKDENARLLIYFSGNTVEINGEESFIGSNYNPSTAKKSQKVLSVNSFNNLLQAVYSKHVAVIFNSNTDVSNISKTSFDKTSFNLSSPCRTFIWSSSYQKSFVSNFIEAFGDKSDYNNDGLITDHEVYSSISSKLPVKYGICRNPVYQNGQTILGTASVPTKSITLDLGDKLSGNTGKIIYQVGDPQKEARLRRLDSIKQLEAIIWTKVQENKSLYAYLVYLENFPDGANSESAFIDLRTAFLKLLPSLEKELEKEKGKTPFDRANERLNKSFASASEGRYYQATDITKEDLLEALIFSINQFNGMDKFERNNFQAWQLGKIMELLDIYRNLDN
ncbi:MAG: hypothetical protein JXQ87_11290 [Bacteroidia bacterium]